MGGIVTTPGKSKEDVPLWRVSDDSQNMNHKVVRLDPSLPPLEDKDHIQLYEMLKEPVTQRMIGQFAISKKNEYLLMCWAEIEEFKEEEIEKLRQNMMTEMYDAYIKPGSSMQIVGLSNDIIEAYTRQNLSSIESITSRSSTSTLLQKKSEKLSEKQSEKKSEKQDASPPPILDSSTFSEVRYTILCTLSLVTCCELQH
jgi:hypothetical protein